MNKPVKPNITIPESFAKNGIKTDFDSDLMTKGFDSLKPDVLAGDNLNKFIDDTYKGLNYGMAAADAINLINEGETLTVVDGKLTSGATGGGLEVCDIGLALYVDETKGLRRYLNGQIVDINTNTQAFLNRLKDITTLHPSLLCTEEEWQTAKTMSAFGQVGKFVFNYSGDKIVSVRLPRVVNVQGLFDLQNLGMTVSAGLPTHTHTRGTMNITGSIGSYENALPWSNGAFYLDGFSGVADYHGRGNSGDMRGSINFDASRSWTGSTSAPDNPIYGNSTTVQPEAIQYPYFIQIATGSETENNIINEIELNNPYSLFDSKYSDHELNNLSWLKSSGQWNSKAVYTDAYDKLLKIYNGTETIVGLSVKLSTETYTDYDFVLNTTDETFRLPLKNHTADDGNSVLTLYYYVGETVQNAKLIDAGRLLEILPDTLNKLQILIGQPQLSLDNVLPSNCVWLEGATVSRTTYSKLFAIYGTTYGNGDGSTTFVLPNFLNRAIWGSNGFGYIAAGLPNHTHTLTLHGRAGNNAGKNQDASWGYDDWVGGNQTATTSEVLNNAIYGKSSTVQPPAIKVRVYARYQ